MPRCADCKRFVGYGKPDTAAIEVALVGSVLELSGTLYLTCRDCGAWVAETAFCDEEDVADLFAGGPDPRAAYTLAGEPEVTATRRAESARRYCGVRAACTVVRRVAGGDPETVVVTLECEERAAEFTPIG